MLTSIDDNQAIKPTQVSLHIASSKPFCYIGDLKTSPAHIPSVMAETLPSRNMFEGFFGGTWVKPQCSALFAYSTLKVLWSLWQHGHAGQAGDWISMLAQRWRLSRAIFGSSAFCHFQTLFKHVPRQWSDCSKQLPQPVKFVSDSRFAIIVVEKEQVFKNTFYKQGTCWFPALCLTHLKLKPSSGGCNCKQHQFKITSGAYE